MMGRRYLLLLIESVHRIRGSRHPLLTHAARSRIANMASGVRLAAVYAPIGAIIGEWVGASKGLGYLMLLANGRAKTDLMFAALIVLAVFTIVLHFLVDRLAQKYLDRPD